MVLWYDFTILFFIYLNISIMTPSGIEDVPDKEKMVSLRERFSCDRLEELDKDTVVLVTDALLDAHDY